MCGTLRGLNMFKQKLNLKFPYQAKGDQPQAIDKLVKGYQKGLKSQVLLGVTGSGKTFTIANVINKINKPTLVISHNKTLAGQLYQEYRDFFPDNAVSYFVSYYDYYQPEAYLPQTDTYIEKETEINDQIDKLRLSATANLLNRHDNIVIASVSCIYNIGSPVEYSANTLNLTLNTVISSKEITEKLVVLQYIRNEFGFNRGTFRIRGQYLDIYPAYEDFAVRIHIPDGKISNIEKVDVLTGKIIGKLKKISIYPAKHYMTDSSQYKRVFNLIRSDLKDQLSLLKRNGKLLEAQRLEQRVSYDLEMIENIGYINGIENYSRYFDNRKPGEAPFTLFDFFNHPYNKDWLLVIDESHMTVPQIRGMYNGDRSRKQTLVDFGFRLPAALDNRPLTFDEFLLCAPQVIYVSATPAVWEKQKAGRVGLVEQLIRPTGLVDPEISIRKSKNQVEDLVLEINKRLKKKERVLVITLTKRNSEDLSEYLGELNYKVAYLHSDIETLKRGDILDKLRLGEFDVLIGINLLREGLDLPEVSLVAILDADREGFLRSETSLIQTMGRAARNISGEIILYADNMTESIKKAVSEVDRRRKIQSDYNTLNKIKPRSISKPIRKRLIENIDVDSDREEQLVMKVDSQSLLPADKRKLTKQLTKMMKAAAEDYDFETAAKLRDKIKEILI